MRCGSVNSDVLVTVRVSTPMSSAITSIDYYKNLRFIQTVIYLIQMFDLIRMIEELHDLLLSINVSKW